MIDLFRNPITIAVCEIDTARLSADNWLVDATYQHSNRKYHPIRIEARQARTIGTPIPKALIVTVGRVAPTGSRYRIIRADYAKVFTPNASDLAEALEDAICQLHHQLDHIQQRANRLATYERFEMAAGRTL